MITEDMAIAAELEAINLPQMDRIKAPRPRRRPDPWQPLHPREEPAEIAARRRGEVKATTIRQHFGGDSLRKVGEVYSAPAERMANLAHLGFVRLDATSDDHGWFDEPDPAEITGPAPYDGSFGPLVRVRCREAGVPAAIPQGGITFRRGYPGIFHVPVEDGEVFEVSECEAIYLAGARTVEIIDPLTDRGRRFQEGLAAKKLHGVYY